MEDWPLEYVRKVLAQTGLSPTALAEKAGVSSTTLTRPLNSPDYAHSVSRRTLDKIRDATGIEFDGASRLARVDDPSEAPNGATLIPVYDVAASAGHGALVDYEAQVTSLAFPPDYLKHLTSSHPRHLAIISVKGESMEQTLLDDDIVLLDGSKRSLAFDGLFVLQMDGALHVKRIGRGSKAGWVRVISDNKLYDTFEREMGEIEVVGKVLWYGRKV